MRGMLAGCVGWLASLALRSALWTAAEDAGSAIALRCLSLAAATIRCRCSQCFCRCAPLLGRLSSSPETDQACTGAERRMRTGRCQSACVVTYAALGGSRRKSAAGTHAEAAEVATAWAAQPGLVMRPCTAACNLLVL